MIDDPALQIHHLDPWSHEETMTVTFSKTASEGKESDIIPAFITAAARLRLVETIESLGKDICRIEAGKYRLTATM